MKEKLEHFEKVISSLSLNSIKDLEDKISSGKWSKKEIIGHLVDSALNNIQRFTEIQYSEKPYTIRRYNQDELVKANHYQQENSQELFNLWLQLNVHILHLMKSQTSKTLKYEIVLKDNFVSDLQFLMEDYLEHFYHHLKHIFTDEYNF